MELKNRSRRHFFWNTVYINIHWTNPVLWKSFGRCAPWKRLAVDCARRRRSRLCRRFCSSTGSLRHGRLPSGSGLSRPSERCRSAGQPTCHRATEWAQITGRFGDEFVRAVNTQKHQKKKLLLRCTILSQFTERDHWRHTVGVPPQRSQQTDGRKSMGIPMSFGLAMTLTSDLWPWKPFQQRPLTWRIFVASFVEIPPLSTEISRQVKLVLTDGRPADRPEDTMPLDRPLLAVKAWMIRNHVSKLESQRKRKERAEI